MPVIDDGEKYWHKGGLIIVNSDALMNVLLGHTSLSFKDAEKVLGKLKLANYGGTVLEHKEKQDAE